MGLTSATVCAASSFMIVLGGLLSEEVGRSAKYKLYSWWKGKPTICVRFAYTFFIFSYSAEHSSRQLCTVVLGVMYAERNVQCYNRMCKSPARDERDSCRPYPLDSLQRHIPARLRLHIMPLYKVHCALQHLHIYSACLSPTDADQSSKHIKAACRILAPAWNLSLRSPPSCMYEQCAYLCALA